MTAKSHGGLSMAPFAWGDLIGSVLALLVAKALTDATGTTTPAFWFVSRAAGIVGYVLLWISTAWGILMSSRAVRALVSNPLAFTLHNVTAWLALGFSTVHAWALLGDRVVPFRLSGILLPFTAAYRPVLTGLGTLSLYVGLLVSLSFYLPRRIGPLVWRLIHTLSYLVFAAVTLHGIQLGTDSGTLVMRVVYFLATGSVLFLTLFRILAATIVGTARGRVQATTHRPTGFPQ